MKQQQLALNTVSLRGEFVDVLDAVAGAGFPLIEFPVGQVKDYLREHPLSDVVSLLQAHDLTCVGGFYGGLEISEEKWPANKATHVEIARILAELGGGTTQNMVVGTDGRSLWDIEDPIATYAGKVADLAGEIAPLGVNLLIEFNWGAVKTLTLAAEIARQSGAANAGVLFDPAHYYCTPTKLADLTPENVAAIKHVHVNNMRRKPADLSNCNSDRLLPDDPAGAIDLKELFGALENNGYQGVFAIEMFSEELWSLTPAEAAGRMYRSLLSLSGA